PSVAPIGLRELPRAAGEVPRLPRIDDDDGESARREGGGDGGFIPPGRLQDHERRTQGRQPLHESGPPPLGARHGKRLPGPPHAHLNGRLRDIDSYKHLSHVPSLSMRAVPPGRLFGFTLCNRRRGTKLNPGLEDLGEGGLPSPEPLSNIQGEWVTELAAA